MLQIFCYEDKAPLGWSFSLKDVAIPLFIGLLAGYNDKAFAIHKLIANKLGKDVDCSVFYRLLRENMGAVTLEQATRWLMFAFMSVDWSWNTIITI